MLFAVNLKYSNAAQALTSLAASVLEAGLPRMHNYVGPDGGSDSDIVFLNDDDFDDSVEEIVYHDTSRTPPPMLFDQAVILYQRCLAYQKARYIEGKEAEKERQRGLANCMVAPSSGPLEIHNYTRIGKSMARPTMDRWALREERVTEDTLLDTSIAHMKALVALCTSLAEEDVPSINLRWLEGGTACKLLSLMRARAEDTGRQLEVAPLLLAFTSAFAYYSYRSGDLNLLLYEKKIQEVISNPLLEFAGSQQLLLAKARALLLFVQSASGHELLEQHDEKCTQEQLDVMQWKYLTEAIESLNAASKMPTSKLSASIHLLRGDVELRRYAFLSSAVTLSIGKCGPRIVQNAETYFRGSAALAARHDDRKVAQEASVKEAIASWLLGSNERMVDCLVEFKARRLILKLVRDCEEKGILNAFRAAKLKKYIRAMQNKLDAMEG
ncbi:MAG: hypothetical protein M1829_006888 [Trizodia sp. TS-e1964]|nr:MAG: hypothetical protein M1829_006888 [Trizodia sp. TS-e1964]